MSNPKAVILGCFFILLGTVGFVLPDSPMRRVGIIAGAIPLWMAAYRLACLVGKKQEDKR